jgi:hypothetical protein
MFPYRRGNQRKRSKGNPPRRTKGGGRRLPGSARELLPLLQPTTKALAQVLAGNVKASGQFVHARNVVERADQLVAEQQVDRLGLRDREEFLEQLARLKLTVSDAEAEFGSEIADAAASGDDGELIEGFDVEVEDEAEDGETDEAVLAERRRQAEAQAQAEAEARAAEEAEAEAERQTRLRRVALALMQPPSEPVEVSVPTEVPAPMNFDEAEAFVRRPSPRRTSRREAAAEETPERPAPRSRSTRPKLTMRGAERDAADAKAADEGLASEG